MVTTKTIARAKRIPLTAPVGDGLTREDPSTSLRAGLVAGLRSVFQQSQIELALRAARSGGRDSRLYAFAIACALADVAEQFGLMAGEVEEILGEGFAREIGPANGER